MKGSVLVTIFFSIWEKTLHDLFSQHKIYVRSQSWLFVYLCCNMIISHPLILAFYDIPLEGLAPDDSFCQLENYHLMGKVRQKINLQN